MLVRSALMLGLTVVGTSASALSCASWGGAEIGYVEAQHAVHDFITVFGRFDFERHFMEEEGAEYQVDAHFTGQQITADGVLSDLDTDVTVQGFCINGDCGYVTPEYEVLTFLHEAEDGLVAYSVPCGGFPMSASEENLIVILSCMRGNECIPNYQ